MNPLWSALTWIWALPWTLVGLLVGSGNWVFGGRFQRQGRIIEAHGPLIRWLFARFPNRPVAMTLGHIVLGWDLETLERTRRHEAVHVRQYERWGPLFIPLYVALSLRAWYRGEHPYLDNPLEKEAFAADISAATSPANVDNFSAIPIRGRET